VAGASDGVRIDHSDFSGNPPGEGDNLRPTGLSTNTLIDHNHFHDIDTRHVIVLGCCGPMFDYHDSGHVVEQNLFTNCQSGSEIISIKSSNATVRYNTFRRSQGDIDIRAGRRDSIYGNYVFGSGGVRLYEDDHRIFNNYIQAGQALQMGPGHAGHAPVKNATVVFNTFLGGVSISGTGNVIANNLVVGGSAPVGPGNLGGTAAALGLVQQGERLVPTASSKVVGAAQGSFPFVTDDVAGRPRGGPLDVGAEQVSAAPSLRPPLTTADVGPDAPEAMDRPFGR
jgi:poly(beta-D-mannuronate) lyase